MCQMSTEIEGPTVEMGAVAQQLGPPPICIKGFTITGRPVASSVPLNPSPMLLDP